MTAAEWYYRDHVSDAPLLPSRPLNYEWCRAISRATGLSCSRRAGHTGRHAAHGLLRPDGTRPLYQVWVGLR